MKTALISALLATLLGFASLASGRHLDVADFTAILFATGLVAWTISQYQRAPRPLVRARVLRLASAPVSVRKPALAPLAGRLAA